MKNLIMHKKGESSWVRWIKKRIQNNLNFLAILTGETGVGKSYNALRIAYEIDPEFNVYKQCAFSFSEFMRAVNGFNGDDEELKDKKYKIVVFDEVQTSVNKREWQSKVNKLFNYLISTFRHQNIIVLFTSPYSDFVDINTMKLMHAKFECKGWNNKDKSSIRAKILQYNDRLRKFYEHSLYVIHNKKAVKFSGLWWLDKPPKHIFEPYEDRKTEFTHRLNKKITRELEEMDKGLYETDNTPKKPLDPRSIQPLVWEEAQKGYYDQYDLSERVSKLRGRRVTQSEISRAKMYLYKKGYDISRFAVRRVK